MLSSKRSCGLCMDYHCLNCRTPYTLYPYLRICIHQTIAFCPPHLSRVWTLLNALRGRSDNVHKENATLQNNHGYTDDDTCQGPPMQLRAAYGYARALVESHGPLSLLAHKILGLPNTDPVRLWNLCRKVRGSDTLKESFLLLLNVRQVGGSGRNGRDVHDCGVAWASMVCLDSVDDVLKYGELINTPSQWHKWEGAYTVPPNGISGVDFGHGHHGLLKPHVGVRARIRTRTDETLVATVDPREVRRRDI